MMIINTLRFIFYVFILFQTLIPKLTLAITTKPPPFNLSHFIYPKIYDEFRPEPSIFLKDVLGAISEKRKWSNEDIEVTNLDLEKAEFAILSSYDLSFRVGSISEFAYTLKANEVSKWSKVGEFGEFERLVEDLSSKGVVDEFEIQGPFELRAKGGDHRFQLMLPVWFLFGLLCCYFNVVIFYCGFVMDYVCLFEFISSVSVLSYFTRM
ncbi:hypothetical protein POM88_005332 [Heracleum sosnowskyi]|uniref:Uncharacterized protein n=1 Tax=Heracleum sosnowskyi TaxID=360622 RepID=A0AAD8JJP8_9APIA|nr:hypothetical protein POM88_005332 [Heracleum sosnowskyi]